MIAFKDFAPEMTREGFFSIDFEPFHQVVDEANEWIDTCMIDVINIETVLLPAVTGDAETETSYLFTNGERMSRWCQFIRVWYRKDISSPPPLP